MCCHIIVDAHAISYKMLNIIWQGFTRFKLVQSLQCLHFVPIVQNRIIELWGHEKVSSSPLDDNRPKLNPYWVLTPQILTQHQWKGKGVKPGAFPEPAISGCTTQEQTHRGQVNSSHSSISPQRGEHNSCLVWTAWPADLRVEQTVAQCGPVTRPERLNTAQHGGFTVHCCSSGDRWGSKSPTHTGLNNGSVPAETVGQQFILRITFHVTQSLVRRRLRNEPHQRSNGIKGQVKTPRCLFDLWSTDALLPVVVAVVSFIPFHLLSDAATLES